MTGEDPKFFRNLVGRSGGDIRSLLNILESVCLSVESGELQESCLDGAQQFNHRFDDGGEAKYTLISAFHKSLRDSDGDAAVYYLGRMLAGGEDPRYIARRMMNFASEDVDISEENCLILAHTVYEVCEKMGMPECELPLIRVVYILAQAKKNNHVLVAQQRMRADLIEYGNLPVPLHLRNASHPALSQLGYGKGYEYAPNMPDGHSNQEHFPEVLQGKKYLYI